MASFAASASASLPQQTRAAARGGGGMLAQESTQIPLIATAAEAIGAIQPRLRLFGQSRRAVTAISR